MKEKIVLTWLLIFSLNAHSQDSLQLIRGRITNETTGVPISNAAITLIGTSGKTCSSDSSGYYSGQVPAGLYKMLVQRQGFKSELRNNIMILLGKQQVQDFELKEFKVELDSVSVVSSATANDNVSLDLWNTQRFAAVFYDPARTVTSSASIINSDDQANNVSVRGTSPNFVQWKVEGLEVVNPNHLENAGTGNDRASLNGGGVSLFSNQILKNSTFQFAPFDPANGNSLSGIFDMKLRNGNNEKYERVLQASLLGIDFSVEGPFSKNSSSSFLVNYRYSTIGLLSKIGVDFGGEKTSFQDLSFVISLPFRGGQVKFFSISGTSETTFDGAADTTEITTQKDLQNIDYFSKTSINGVNYIHTLSNTLFVRSIAAYSIKSVSRFSVPTGLTALQLPEEKDILEQQKISGVTYISKRLGNWLRLKAGSYYNYFISKAYTAVNDLVKSDGTLSDPLLQPFVSVEGTVLGKLDVKAGLHSLYQVRIKDFTLQPRLNLQYNVSPKQYVAFKYGRTAQIQPFYLSVGSNNLLLKPTISDAYAIVHHLTALSLDFKTEVFLNYFERLPINKLNGFSAYNYFNEAITFPLEQTGKGRLYGVDFTVEKNMNTYYIIASSSIFKSEYALDNTYYSARYNANYNCALTGGKEYRLKNKNKVLSTDVRWFIRDGFKDAAATTNSYVYNVDLPQYWRIDLRVSYRKNKTKSTVIWALDLQNVTNRKNVAYHYYDMYTQKDETRYQLGLIPVLSYKLYF